MTSKIEYHCMDSCNNCGKDNEVTEVDSMWHLGVEILSEASTVCNTCGFEDYWEHGCFESGRYGYDKCKKYSYYN